VAGSQVSETVSVPLSLNIYLLSVYYILFVKVACPCAKSLTTIWVSLCCIQKGGSFPEINRHLWSGLGRAEPGDVSRDRALKSNISMAGTYGSFTNGSVYRNGIFISASGLVSNVHRAPTISQLCHFQTF